VRCTSTRHWWNMSPHSGEPHPAWKRTQQVPSNCQYPCATLHAHSPSDNIAEVMLLGHSLEPRIHKHWFLTEGLHNPRHQLTMAPRKFVATPRTTQACIVNQYIFWGLKMPIQQPLPYQTAHSVPLRNNVPAKISSA
jgi:hypothetical protein